MIYEAIGIPSGLTSQDYPSGLIARFVSSRFLCFCLRFRYFELWSPQAGAGRSELRVQLGGGVDMRRLHV